MQLFSSFNFHIQLVSLDFYHITQAESYKQILQTVIQFRTSISIPRFTL